jgi:hypothetical protein
VTVVGRGRRRAATGCEQATDAKARWVALLGSVPPRWRGRGGLCCGSCISTWAHSWRRGGAVECGEPSTQQVLSEAAGSVFCHKSVGVQQARHAGRKSSPAL